MKYIEAYQPASPQTGPFTVSPPVRIAKALAGLAEAGITGVNFADLAKMPPVDPIEPALKIMAEIRAYFLGRFQRPHSRTRYLKQIFA